MFRKLVACLLLFVIAPSVPAIECLASTQDQQPILVIGSVKSTINGLDPEKFNDTLRARLGTSFRVLLLDQYKFAVQRGHVDRCTPQFLANIELDAEAGNVVVNGDRLQNDFTGAVQVFRLPETITQDRFRLKAKRFSFVGFLVGGPQKALDKLMDSLADDMADAFQSRRNDWVRARTPGFDTVDPPPSEGETRPSEMAATPAAGGGGYVRIEFIGRDPPPSFTFRAASSDTNRVNGASAGIRFSGVNLPCNTYHLYVDNPPGAGGVARETDLCVASGFIVLPSEVYTLRNRSGTDLVSRNVRVEAQP